MSCRHLGIDQMHTQMVHAHDVSLLRLPDFAYTQTIVATPLINRAYERGKETGSQLG